MLTVDDCAAGRWNLAGCGLDLYLPNPCPQPTGACCLPDGSCVELTADECAPVGSYQGDGTVL